MDKADQAPAGGDDRFSRFRLITWWQQDKLSQARVLLIGAGALGNEILKNLALLGVGQVFLADLDLVENSNLSRSILFRAEDCGLEKAAAAAARAREVYPSIQVQPWRGNVVYDLGLGIYRWADIVMAGLDNREARVAINRSAARAGKVWIDGAIEHLNGVARVFDPATGPCYECTMNETDWRMLEVRRSCALLTRDDMVQGKVPTTPTTASVIAAIQTQEAVKYLHGMEVLEGHGIVFDGLQHDNYKVRYTRKPDCPSHEPYAPIDVLDWQAGATTLGQMAQRVREDLGDGAVVEFNQDLLSALYCPGCDREEVRHGSLGKVTEREGLCPACSKLRQPRIFHTADGREPFADRSLAELGVPPWDIVGGRVGGRLRYYELGGDKAAVLGSLAIPEAMKEATAP